MADKPDKAKKHALYALLRKAPPSRPLEKHLGSVFSLSALCRKQKKPLEEAARRYFTAGIDEDGGQQREAIVAYLTSVKELLHLLRDYMEVDGPVIDYVLDDLRAGILSVSTENPHPMFPPKRQAKPHVSPRRIDYLAQLSAVVTHLMDYDGLTVERAAKLVTQKLDAAGKRLLKTTKGNRNYSLWRSLINVRDRISSGGYGDTAKQLYARSYYEIPDKPIEHYIDTYLTLPRRIPRLDAKSIDELIGFLQQSQKSKPTP